MSKFLTEVKNETDNEAIAKWIRIGERADERPVEHNLFNFMLDVGKHTYNSTAGCTAYHWLKWCERFYRDGDSFILNYTDKNSATWALNFIGNGVKFSQKCKNVIIFFNGEYVDSLLPPNRKTEKRR